jgi:hypothetical protein
MRGQFEIVLPSPTQVWSTPLGLPGRCGGRMHQHSTSVIRATLHLEAGPIRCVRVLKSSLVIGQKAQIGLNPFAPRGRADLVG